MGTKYLRSTVLLAILLGVLYGITRLLHLTSLPIFTDEAIYIRWAQIGAQDANWRFISLTDGKQPFFTWVVMGLLRVVKGDPLFAGRLASVIAGFFTMTGIWFLTNELFNNKRIAWLSALFYVMFPMAVWYDRMALYDSWVAAYSVWNLYLAILLVRRQTLDVALLLGMTLGLGMLNKTSAFLSLYFLPVTFLLIDFRKEGIYRRIGRWIGLVVLCAGLSQAIYSILRLSPFFYIVSQKDNVFVFTPEEWLNQPFRFFAGNLKGMFDWLRHYATIPFFLLSLFSLFMRSRFVRELWVLYLWWILPFIALANFAKILYPRFIFFMTMPLIVLGAYAFVTIWMHIKKPLVRAVFVCLIAMPMIVIGKNIVLDPVQSEIPISDRSQYIDDWPAGGGVKEVLAYLSEETLHNKVTVYTEGTFGLLPYALEIYLSGNPNVTIKGIWPLPEEFPLEIATSSTTEHTYFLMNETQRAPYGWPLTLVGEYQKGRRTDRKLRLFRVNPPIAYTL